MVTEMVGSSLEVILFRLLAKPIARALMARYLQLSPDLIGEDLLDLAQVRIEDYADQKEASRLFDRIGDRVVQSLMPLFIDVPTEHVAFEAVLEEINLTLTSIFTPEFVVAKDIDPEKLTTEMIRQRPLPTAQYSAAETELYERALAASARFLAETAQRLPGFQRAYAAESLSRLSQIGDILQQTLDTVQRIEQYTRESTSTEFSRFEADYREGVIRNLDYLELFGADLSPEAARYSLSVAYVTLRIMTSSDGGIANLPASSALDEISGRENRLLLIRGEAGSGKTTLMRWAAIEAASLGRSELAGGDFQETGFFGPQGDDTSTKLGVDRRQAGHQLYTTSWRFRIPFFVTLRACTDGRLPEPEALPDFVAREIGRPPSSWVRDMLTAGKCLILLDGADEVRDSHGVTVKASIASWIKAYPKNMLVVTTRPAAVPPGWLADVGFVEADVNPLSELDKALFIEKWHVAVQKELTRYGRKESIKLYCDGLKVEIQRNPIISRLASNPLLCAMICALHKDRSQKLPQSLSELMEALCQVLLHRRDRESGLADHQVAEDYGALHYEQKRALIQDIAFHFTLEEESAVAKSGVLDLIKASCQTFPGFSAWSVESILDALIERSGILREKQVGIIDFVHNAFKEYLAADKFVQEYKVTIVAKNALDSQWQPVVIFASTARSKTFASKLITKMLQIFGRRPKREVMLGILQCQSVALHLDKDIFLALRGFEELLFPPKDPAEAGELASAGDSVIKYLKYSEVLAEGQAAASVRTLRLIGSYRAKECLQDYLQDYRNEVVAELAQAVDPLVIGAVRRKLQDGRRLDEGIVSQIAGLSELDNMWSLRRILLSGSRVSNIESLAS